MGESRKNLFDELATEMKCNAYQPCPLCFKCMNRGMHLYEKCDQCAIPICGHKQKDREHLIRPKNFTLGKNDQLAHDILNEFNIYLENKEATK